MAARRIVVDGSNIATEGRTLPSLRQLNEAVLAFLTEYPEAEVTVVVDATFGHRIDPTELQEFEEAEANNELVSPPAGAIGRGDAFLLRIAGKIGAMVLSNDSFQEFHGEHEWLFDEGRLIGGKPVPGIGWIFTPRTPVRGLKSRKAVKEAKRKGKGVEDIVPTISGEALGPRPVPKAPPPRRRDSGAAAAGRKDAQVAEAIATATEESVAGSDGPGRKRRRKKRLGRPAEPVNDALAFITFIAEHPLGSEVAGEVETFTSHGAFVLAGGARCYVPISALGEPPPRAARDVLNRGERRTFVVQALDPQRRGIELALPEFAKVAGAPLPETIEAEITEAPVEHVAVPAVKPGRTPAGARAGTRAAPRGAPVPVEPVGQSESTPVPAARAAGGRKRATGRAPVPVGPGGDAAAGPSDTGAAPATERAQPTRRAIGVTAGRFPAGTGAAPDGEAAGAAAPAKRTRKRAGGTAAAPVAPDQAAAPSAGPVVTTGVEPPLPAAPATAAPAKRTRKTPAASVRDTTAVPTGPAPRPRRVAPAAEAPAGIEAPAPPDGAAPSRTPRRNPAKSTSHPAAPTTRRSAGSGRVPDSGKVMATADRGGPAMAADGSAAGPPAAPPAVADAVRSPSARRPKPAVAAAAPEPSGARARKAGATVEAAKAKPAEAARRAKAAPAPKATKTAAAPVKPAKADKADKPPKAKASKAAKRQPKS